MLIAFNNRYPGIEVSFYEANSSHADEKYFVGHAAGRNPVDIMQIEWYEKYKKDGLLADLSEIVKDSNYPGNLPLRTLMPYLWNTP